MCTSWVNLNITMKDLKDKTDKNTRSLLLDCIRGFTVILMIYFHFNFDLNFFELRDIDIIRAPFWYALPRLIVFLFFFAVGSSLYFAHHKKIHWNSLLKRQGLLLFWSLIISVVTYIAYPQNWIYFGTLHSIFTITFMSLPFLKYPKLSLVLAIALFIPSIFWDKTIPWIELSHSSWDYISPFPWVGASFLGIFAASRGLYKLPFPNNKMTRALSYLGRHSLFIYITHQPILFGIIITYLKVKGFLFN